MRAVRDAFTAGTRWIYNFKRDSIVLLPGRVEVGGLLFLAPTRFMSSSSSPVLVCVCCSFGFVPFSKAESLNSLCLAFIYSICAHAAIILWPLAKHENHVQWKCYRRHVSCTLPSLYYRFFGQIPHKKQHFVPFFVGVRTIRLHNFFTVFRSSLTTRDVHPKLYSTISFSLRTIKTPNVNQVFGAQNQKHDCPSLACSRRILDVIYCYYYLCLDKN